VVNILYKYTNFQYLLNLRRTEELSRIPARDWFSSALAGLLFVIETDDGRVIYSMSHRERFSRSLDVFDQRRGSLLVRGAEVWEGLPVGEPGEALVVSADGVPTWGAVAATGGGIWVNALNANGRWYFTYEDQSKVQYREIRAGGEDWAACAVPILGQVRVECTAFYRTMGVGSGSVKLRLSVYGGGPARGMTLLGTDTKVVAVPGADARYFSFSGGVGLPAWLSELTMLVVEVRRLGDDPEDDYPRSIGFFGMLVRFL
jgi:hypothetical protein